MEEKGIIIIIKQEQRWKVHLQGEETQQEHKECNDLILGPFLFLLYWQPSHCVTFIV